MEEFPMAVEHCPVDDCPNYVQTQANIKTWMKWTLSVIIILSAVHGMLASATYQVAQQSADSLAIFVDKYNATDKNVAINLTKLESDTKSFEYRLIILEQALAGNGNGANINGNGGYKK